MLGFIIAHTCQRSGSTTEGKWQEKGTLKEGNAAIQTVVAFDWPCSVV